ncbi:group II truncated hemoglobin [uncultured Sulfitobacter sp.]|uniref:group II truncated hemoglobin n=1 Tax=uncultured Sulfitobacter sp. TaxID=191468 RepID=UPI0026152FD5|nr:group II truncated hemoglobin [uncultured Sulfitobacter sp.]
MTRTVLDQIGGEDALRTMVEHFYDLVESLPEGRQIVHLHMEGHGIAHTRQEQFNFMSGFMGGRQYYMEKHRHMNVKEIHAHVPIRVQDAEDWLSIMDKTLADLNHTGPHIDRLRTTLRRVALILVNDGKVA